MSLPKHIAFIMDGNGRWGKSRGKGRNYGHLRGVKIVEDIVKLSSKLKIPYLTFYVFSTENWSRPKKEIQFLFNLINIYFEKELNSLIKSGVKIKIIGQINKLPLKIYNRLKYVIKKTEQNNNITIILHEISRNII